MSSCISLYPLDLREAAAALGQQVPESAERLRLLGETFVIGDDLIRISAPFGTAISRDSGIGIDQVQ